MSQREAVEPARTPIADLIALLSTSPAVGRARISTRGAFLITDTSSGDVLEGEGPALILVVNERLLNQGW